MLHYIFIVFMTGIFGAEVWSHLIVY